MYLRHFAFSRLPFADAIEADLLFASAARQEAEARLQHLLQLRGIGLLTGEPGGGKTTVCRAVTAVLHPGAYRVLYVSLTTGNVMDMYKSIAWELGLPAERSRAAAYRSIRTEITRQVREANRMPVLIIDDAQFLRTDVLDDLRLLTNYSMDSEHRLHLAGCELPLFEPSAAEALFQASRGLPRQINRIAHYALSATALDDARTVTVEHLQTAVEELRL